MHISSFNIATTTVCGLNLSSRPPKPMAHWLMYVLRSRQKTSLKNALKFVSIVCEFCWQVIIVFFFASSRLSMSLFYCVLSLWLIVLVTYCPRDFLSLWLLCPLAKPSWESRSILLSKMVDWVTELLVKKDAIPEKQKMINFVRE